VRRTLATFLFSTCCYFYELARDPASFRSYSDAIGIFLMGQRQLFITEKIKPSLKFSFSESVIIDSPFTGEKEIIRLKGDENAKD